MYLGSYLSLQVAYKHAVEDFAGLVAVADILEGFGRVLATDIEKDFLATTVRTQVSKTIAVWREELDSYPEERVVVLRGVLRQGAGVRQWRQAVRTDAHRRSSTRCTPYRGRQGKDPSSWRAPRRPSR